MEVPAPRHCAARPNRIPIFCLVGRKNMAPRTDVVEAAVKTAVPTSNPDAGGENPVQDPTGARAVVQGWGPPWTRMATQALVPPSEAMGRKFAGLSESTWLYVLLAAALASPVIMVALGGTGFMLAVAILGATHGLGWYFHLDQPAAAEPSS